MCSLLCILKQWTNTVHSVISRNAKHNKVKMGVVYKRMLDHWEISTEKVPLVLRALPLLGCFAYSLQLVENGVLSQRAVIDVLASCRTIFGHFKHSSVAYGCLCSIHECLGVSQHRLQQDLHTRWNSSLYMVNPVIEQKMLLAAYATETGIVTLSLTQMDLAEKNSCCVFIN